MTGTLRLRHVGLAVVTLLAGCAPSPAMTAPPTPRPTQGAPPVAIPSCSAVTVPSATAPPDLLITPAASTMTATVTNADNGATVFLIAGQHLVVKVGFPGPPAWSGPPHGAEMYWDVPATTSPGRLFRNGSTTCPGGGALAMFTAVGTGGTTVEAMSDAPCLHARPACQIPQALVAIYVVVR
jgi:hypothetical protein